MEAAALQHPPLQPNALTRVYSAGGEVGEGEREREKGRNEEVKG